jgi:flagellar biosynthetic protein FliO
MRPAPTAWSAFVVEFRRRFGRWRRVVRHPAFWLGGLGLLLVLGLETFSGLRPAGPPAAPLTPAGLGAAPEALASGGLVVDVILKLGLVIGLIYASLYLLRRWQAGSLAPRSRAVTLLETTRLSPRQAVHVVRAGGQTFLIGATDQSVTLLAELEPAPEPAALAEPASSTGFPGTFTQILGRAAQAPNGVER